MTGEHVFPNWLNDVFPNDVVGDTDVLQRLVVQDQIAPDRIYTKKDVASLTTRRVCARCNNGWMSVLEGQAKGLVTALASGTTTALSPEDQLLLATWAVKTFLVVETTFGQDLLSQPGDRQIVMSQSRPPAHYRVWASAYVGDIGPLRTTVLASTLDDPEGVLSGRVYLGTLQVGSLVLQIGGGDSTVPTGDGVERYGTSTPRRVQCFPPLASATWPPKEMLDDHTFIAATQELSILDRRIPNGTVPGLHDLTHRPENTSSPQRDA